MATVGQARATLDDLLRTPEKAELIGGRIVTFMATGSRPNEVAGNIYVSLRNHASRVKRGKAYTDNMGFAVAELPSGRESFSPDASYYDGPIADPMGFVQGPPNFAAEVRSEGDYTSSALAALAEKRDDYFLAGTQVVWDVDPLAETVAVYRSTAPDQPTIYKHGDIVEAEPAVPGWRMSVADVFA